MRGKKSYNIRNIEAHLHNFSSTSFNNNTNTNNTFTSPSYMLNKNMAFENNQQTNHQTQLNEYINAKYGVSKYASNLVSGKMFKNM